MLDYQGPLTVSSALKGTDRQTRPSPPRQPESAEPRKEAMLLPTMRAGCCSHQELTTAWSY